MGSDTIFIPENPKFHQSSMRMEAYGQIRNRILALVLDIFEIDIISR